MFRIQHLKLLIGLLITLTLTACAFAPLKLVSGIDEDKWQWVTTSDSFEVPFQTFDESFIIPVVIDGTTLHLQYQPRVPVTLIYETDKTKTLFKSLSTVIISFKGTIEERPVLDVIKFDSMGLGDLQANDVYAAYLEVNDTVIFHNQNSVVVDGVIGLDLIKQFPIEFDHDRQVLRFYRTTNTEEIIATKANSSAWSSLPISLANNQILISGQIQDEDNQPLDVSLTYSSDNFELYPKTVSNSIEYTHHYTQSKLGSEDNLSTTKIGRIPSLTLGKFNVEHPITSLDEDIDGFTAVSDGKIGGLLHNNFNILLNYKQQHMMITPNRQFPTKAKFDRSGLRVKANLKGAEVQAVAKESTASQLNIAPFDVITSINGQAINFDNYDALTDLFSSQADTLELCWITPDTTKSRCDSLELRDRH